MFYWLRTTLFNEITKPYNIAKDEAERIIYIYKYFVLVLLKLTR